MTLRPYSTKTKINHKLPGPNLQYAEHWICNPGIASLNPGVTLTFCKDFFYLDFTTPKDYFINFELSQSLGGAKMGDP